MEDYIQKETELLNKLAQILNNSRIYANVLQYFSIQFFDFLNQKNAYAKFKTEDFLLFSEIVKLFEDANELKEISLELKKNSLTNTQIREYLNEAVIMQRNPISKSKQQKLRATALNFAKLRTKVKEF